MIQPERIQARNRRGIARGHYVLHWMQGAQRSECNHALEHAIDLANDLQVPVVTVFALTPDYPQANERHYLFMLQGLADARRALAQRGIQMVVRIESPPACIVRLAKDASAVVTDGGYLAVQRQWRQEVAENISCRLVEVETDVIVPVHEASDKENFSAATFRPRIRGKLDRYLTPLGEHKVRIGSLGLRFAGLDLRDVAATVRGLKIDHSVDPVTAFKGGATEANRRLNDFIANKLDDYDRKRNDPNVDGISNLSPYLHFGQISPLEVALQVSRAKGEGKESFLEELIVRRELSFNFVHYNSKYNDFDCLPVWAKTTLAEHRADKREYVYSLEHFETAHTHDPYWNAAQKEMILTGKMHSYMRMYWGKKILEWSRDPHEAFQTALYLNNKYELDGRGPNAFAGVAWCFGKHDRAWTERPVFGKIRYMNAAGLKRKFDPDAYVRKIAQLESRA
jgi:deoxyribodipyrimidine photo-lyase